VQRSPGSSNTVGGMKDASKTALSVATGFHRVNVRPLAFPTKSTVQRPHRGRRPAVCHTSILVCHSGCTVHSGLALTDERAAAPLRSCLPNCSTPESGVRLLILKGMTAGKRGGGDEETPARRSRGSSAGGPAALKNGDRSDRWPRNRVVTLPTPGRSSSVAIRKGRARQLKHTHKSHILL
jgi:hypothetical protein